MAPTTTTGRVVEVDLKRQILLVVLNGRIEWVLDASTGSRAGTMPTGRFEVSSEVDGADAGPLGVLHRPKYFVRGVAVHRSDDVQPRPPPRAPCGSPSRPWTGSGPTA